VLIAATPDMWPDARISPVIREQLSFPASTANPEHGQSNRPVPEYPRL
jgi:hypothetical protein